MDRTYQFSVADAQQWKSADLAAILHNLRFWLDKNKANNHNIHDGYVWTYNTQQAWVELFPWLSVDQIRRLLKKLEDAGLLIKGNYNQNPFDKTVWYTLNEPRFRTETTDDQKCRNSATAPEIIELAESPHRKCGIAESDKRNRRIFTDKKQTDKKQTTTTKPCTFDTFALILIGIINEMVVSGGMVAAGQPVPNPVWLREKAASLYDKFPDPNPADCAVLILKDWTTLISSTAGLKQVTPTTKARATR